MLIIRNALASRRTALSAVPLALLLVLTLAVAGEEPSSFQRLARATVAISKDHGAHWTCTATVFKEGGRVFLISAGHCVGAPLSYALIGFADGGEIGLNTRTVMIRLLRDFRPQKQDIALWQPAYSTDRERLYPLAISLPLRAFLDEYQEIVCLQGAIGPLTIGKVKYTQAFIVPIRGITGAALAMPGQERHSDIYTFGALSWHGMSGSLCYDSRLLPVGMIVGGEEQVIENGQTVLGTVVKLPTFIEGAEAINAVLDYIRGPAKESAPPGASSGQPPGFKDP